MIFERSRRSTLVLFALVAFAILGGLLAAVVIYVKGGSERLVLLLFCLSVVALPPAVQLLLKLRAWPPGRLGLFRDRLVLLEGRLEQHMPWDRIELATLGSATAWTSGRTSIISMTDRLTLRLKRWRGGHLVRFRPADFGLEPVGCRDLILRLRDDPSAREALPEFDSALDLSVRPRVSGELISPRL